MGSRDRKLGIIVAGLGLAVSIFLAFSSDAFKRYALVGQWRCDPYFSGKAHDLTFLRGGSYAEFDTASKDASEHGTWDVIGGRLVLITSTGGSTYSVLNVSPTGSRFDLGGGHAVCSEWHP